MTLRRVTALFVVLMVVLAAVAVITEMRPGWYVRWQHPIRYPNYIRTHADNHRLPPALLAAVIQRESGFDHTARSSAGAVGLMQLTPKTARGIATRTHGTRFTTADLLDPELNIRYGSWYLAHLHEHYRERERGAHPDQHYVLTLAAYNAGQGRVDAWLKADDDDHLTVSEIPFAETRHYVEAVLELQRDYERAYAELRE